MARKEFLYFSGTVKQTSDEWSYDLEVSFRAQLELQPQYKSMTDIHDPSGIPEGAYHIVNMVIGLADDDYRAGYAVGETGQSEFAKWVEENRQDIYDDAAVWFQE